MAHLSVIIPAYNEEKRLALTLEKIHDFFVGKNYTFEIIVVDDGSTDGTARIANESKLAKEGKLKVLKNGVNKGKGFSVKNGISSSAGDYVLFSDADLSTPIKEADRFLNSMDDGTDIIIGSRSTRDSNVITHQPWYREIMGKTFNLFIKIFIMRGLNDTQCGFKLFKGNIARDIANDMQIPGFAFDVEMLYIARIKKYKVKELGVIWENSPESKVKLFHSPINMFLDLFKIRMAHSRLK